MRDNHGFLTQGIHSPENQSQFTAKTRDKGRTAFKNSNPKTKENVNTYKEKTAKNREDQRFRACL